MMDGTQISEGVTYRFQQMLTQHFIQNRSRPKNPDGLFLYYFSDLKSPIALSSYGRP